MSLEPDVTLLAGRFEGMHVPELLWQLARERATGRLQVYPEDGFARTLHFDGGTIVFASSQDPDTRLGIRLLQQGHLSLDALDEALARQQADATTSKRIGELLVACGAIDVDVLQRSVAGQLRSIIFGLFAVDRGTYRFVADRAAADESITPGLDTDQLLLAGVRQVTSLRRLRRAVGGLSTVYARVEGAVEIRDEAERQIVDLLEQGPRTIESLCQELLLSSYEMLQRLWGLTMLGAVERVVPGRELRGDPNSGIPSEAASFLDVMLLLHRGAESGVLYASRNAVDRSFHLRNGECVFATSSALDDSLVATLLRRGAISLKQGEQAVSRLLSNKRVGEILLELGVLDPTELGEAIRHQVLEVVCDTFRWEKAAYRFAAEDLPSVEAITLNLPFGALVREGLRRTGSWKRMVDGCGGLDTRLALTPDYLRVLDGMRADVEEWEVVTALRSGATPRDVLRGTRISDYRAAQILWCLRTLGAVEPSEVQSVVDDAEARDAEDRRAVAPAESPAEQVEQVEQVGEAVEVEQAVLSAAADDEAPLAAVEQPSLELPVESLQRAVIDEIDELATAGAQLTGSEHEAAAHESAADVEPGSEPLGDGWDPPEDLDQQIVRFNQMQRRIYRLVRAEIGAGAANLIRASCSRHAMEGPDLLAGAQLHSDGSWDSAVLREAAVRNRVPDPGLEYRRLIEVELEVLRDYITERRLAALREELSSLDGVDASA